MSRFGRSDDARLRAELDAVQFERDRARADAGRLRAALDAVPMGIVVVDSSGSELLRNGAAEIGGHAGVLLNAAIDRLILAARGGEATEERVSLFGPPPRVLSVRAMPLPDGGAVATVDDLSERARLDAVRTDFVSNISHELKTPVGALALLAETLADNDDPGVNRRLAARMVDEAHRGEHHRRPPRTVSYRARWSG